MAEINGCGFCRDTEEDSASFFWGVRSTMADDNICEYVRDDCCRGCGGCVMTFDLQRTKIGEDTFLSGAIGKRYQMRRAKRSSLNHLVKSCK